MKTSEQVKGAVKAGRKSQCLDGRDYQRLTDFFPSSEWELFGFTLKDGSEPQLAVKAWTEVAVIDQLRRDVEFGFEKALDRRSISAGLMYEVVKLWLWVLDDPLEHFGEYAQYGLPLFKAVAMKYGFDNPISAKAGNEYEFSSEGEWCKRSKPATAS